MLHIILKLLTLNDIDLCNDNVSKLVARHCIGLMIMKQYATTQTEGKIMVLL